MTLALLMAKLGKLVGDGGDGKIPCAFPFLSAKLNVVLRALISFFWDRMGNWLETLERRGILYLEHSTMRRQFLKIGIKILSASSIFLLFS